MTVHDHSTPPSAGPAGEAEEVTRAVEVTRAGEVQQAGEAGWAPVPTGSTPPTWTAPPAGGMPPTWTPSTADASVDNGADAIADVATGHTLRVTATSADNTATATQIQDSNIATTGQ
jgi:hypothetical protein